LAEHFGDRVGAMAATIVSASARAQAERRGEADDVALRHDTSDDAAPEQRRGDGGTDLRNASNGPRLSRPSPRSTAASRPALSSILLVAEEGLEPPTRGL